MQSPFEDTGEEDALTEVEFHLRVFCVSDGTLNVTSNDLTLDPNHPDIMPIGMFTMSSINAILFYQFPVVWCPVGA